MMYHCFATHSYLGIYKVLLKSSLGNLRKSRPSVRCYGKW